MNLLLTSACNLKCPYCFAGTPPGKPKELSFEDFKKVVMLFKEWDVRQLKLLGGEPTKASRFRAMLDYALADDFFHEVTVFTNGLFDPRLVLKFADERIYLIINTQERSNLKKSQIHRFENNLEKLQEQKARYALGYNIYHNDFQPDFVLEMIKKFEPELLRWSLAYPGSEGARGGEQIKFSDFEIIGNKVFEFVTGLSDEGIYTQQDCCLPLCLFSLEQWKNLLARENVALIPGRCEPAIDINTDLEVFRCFAVPGKHKKKLNDFRGPDDIHNFLKNEVDEVLKDAVADVKCESCRYHKYNACFGGCLSYKSVNLSKGVADICPGPVELETILPAGPRGNKC